MKIDLTRPTPTIDAKDLGEVLDLDPAKVLGLMRDGAITSRFETGVDEDEGAYRFTFWYDDIQVRFTCDATGTVFKTSRIKAKRTR